jgi:hypothetical protein
MERINEKNGEEAEESEKRREYRSCIGNDSWREKVTFGQIRGFGSRTTCQNLTCVKRKKRKEKKNRIDE